MPHQCLNCGHAFEEGSSALLAGCPECKGTRFFYSATAVNQGERERIAEKAQKDLRQVVADLLQDAAPDVAEGLKARAGEDGWADLRPRDLRRLVKEVQKGRQEPGQAGEVDEEAAKRTRRLIEESADEEAKPDTITVHEAGAYEIDVKALMEHNPLVVHKDGAYMIHLPSLFGDKKE